MSKSPITCHVLDSSSGVPARSVKVTLFKEIDAIKGEFTRLAESITNSDGRCQDLLPAHGSKTDSGDTNKLQPGVYKMVFLTGPYWASKGVKTFHPRVEVIFNYEDPGQHYHIPLLCSPFSYTTYRGS